MEEKGFYVYVLRSLSSGTIYVGMATNIESRLKQHNSGKSKFTQSFVPWELIYTEFTGPSTEARKREKYLKSTAGKNFLRKKRIL
ncbi:MAG: GIY-YIG nuclease family protein [Bacteroidetes bacterium]|nr:GIY-YIG nuclease family protein [Bacteroidota bacterium]